MSERPTFRDRLADTLRGLATRFDGRDPARATVAPPRLSEEETYCLWLLSEEAGEVLSVAGKAGRFGLDTPMGREDPATARDRMAAEIGDVLAAVEFATLHRVVDGAAVDASRRRKLAKLLDPDARDNLGRPLAPLPAPLSATGVAV